MQVFCNTDEPDDGVLVSPLEQFLTLAKTATGEDAVEVIKNAIEADGVYEFNGLLTCSNMFGLKNGEFSKYYDLLQVFAYDTYKTYLQKKSQLPELSDKQIKKLKRLTIVSLASDRKCIPYDVLLDELDIPTVADLEEFLTDAFYEDVIKGKMDQKNGQFEITYTFSRDININAKDEFAILKRTLLNWQNKCESALLTIEREIFDLHSGRNSYLTNKELVHSKIEEVKKWVKKTQEEDIMGTEKQDKKTKFKGRGLKFWSNRF